MTLSLKESRACTEMAKLLYNFLPGSGSPNWKGHVTFQTVAERVGVGQFWRGGSKEPAIATLLETTLERRRDLFEPLVLTIVREGLKYREKQNNPVTRAGIEILNGLILEVGFKFSSLWDQVFLGSLGARAPERAAELLRQEAVSERIQISQNAEKENQWAEFKSTFYRLAGENDRQSAGRSLENVLNGMFELSGLSPREPFRVTGEQIDGSFELDNEVYIVEAKWESAKLSEAPLMVFREKVHGKSTITRGILIAINGCTFQALDAITRGKQPNFCIVDGYDLSVVMEQSLGLPELLRAKVRRLAEEGMVFYSAKDIMQPGKK